MRDGHSPSRPRTVALRVLVVVVCLPGGRAHNRKHLRENSAAKTVLDANIKQMWDQSPGRETSHHTQNRALSHLALGESKQMELPR